MESCRNLHDQSWETTYQTVQRLAQELGRLPRLSDGADPRTVNWIANQRRAVRLRNHQRAALECLPGWSWDPKQDAWLERAEQVRQFIATHGRTPRQRVPEESALAHWLSRQKVAHRKGQLSEERSQILEYVLRQ